MSRILIRFNTKHEMDAGHRKWRVVVDGVETLANKVHVTVPCETICEDVGGSEKYHFMCHGQVSWGEDETALVYDENSNSNAHSD